MATLETQLILVREDQVAWLEMVDFDGSSIVVLSKRVSFGSALLFAKLEIIARSRVCSGLPKLDTKVTDDTVPVKSLTVLKPQIPPESVLGEIFFSCDNKLSLLLLVTHENYFSVFMASEKYSRTRSEF